MIIWKSTVCVNVSVPSLYSLTKTGGEGVAIRHLQANVMSPPGAMGI